MNKKTRVLAVFFGIVAALGLWKVSYTAQSSSSAEANSKLRLGSARAEAVLAAVKKARPNLSTNLLKVSNSAAGTTLSTALHNDAVLKGATASAACNQDREALKSIAGIAAGPSCRNTFQDIADQLSCGAVGELLDYFGGGIVVSCQMYTWGSNGVGACGCGFRGCVVLQDDF